jgi:hypothetical protein
MRRQRGRGRQRGIQKKAQETSSTSPGLLVSSFLVHFSFSLLTKFSGTKYMKDGKNKQGKDKSSDAEGLADRDNRPEGHPPATATADGQERGGADDHCHNDNNHHHHHHRVEMGTGTRRGGRGRGGGTRDGEGKTTMRTTKTTTTTTMTTMTRTGTTGTTGMTGTTGTTTTRMRTRTVGGGGGRRKRGNDAKGEQGWDHDVRGGGRARRRNTPPAPASRATAHGVDHGWNDDDTYGSTPDHCHEPLHMGWKGVLREVQPILFYFVFFVLQYL